MTIRELTQLAGQHPLVLIGLFVALPLIALLLGWIHAPDRAGASPWKYFYSVLVYLAAGVFALLKWGTYMLFRRRDEPVQERPKIPGM